MLRVAQECFSGRLGCEHARLSFDAKIELEAADTGNEAHDGLRKVDVEIVAENGPVCGGSGAAEQVAEKPREILFRPGIAYDAFDLASGDVESGDEGLSAVALIFELASLDLARHQRQTRRNTLQRLNAGHFVNGDRAISVIGAGCGLVNRTDIRALAIKGGIKLRS